jgi:hypothetical protein
MQGATTHIDVSRDAEPHVRVSVILVLQGYADRSVESVSATRKRVQSTL